MTSLQPWWWAALPLLLLPLWWHRQKRQRTASELLATARFLPSTAPQQRRIWRWTDIFLLLVRLALLLALIAWLAVTVLPWRGDTVLADPTLEPAWVAREVQAARMQDAARMPLPAGVLDWLRRREHQWRDGTRILVLARAGDVPMPAHPPRLAHAVTLRLAPAVLPAAQRHHVVVASTPERLPRWQALFAAFGTVTGPYTVAAVPTSQTGLIVWDRPESPPAAWRAPHWWRADGKGDRHVTAAGIALTYTDTPQGRIWRGMPWPPASATEAAALQQAWQAVAAAPAPYALPAQALAPARPLSLPARVGEPAPWWGWLLLALFMLERLLAHARRS